MINTQKTLFVFVSCLQVVAITLFVPTIASAHFLNQNVANYMAAVGSADGHDHVHAEEAVKVASDGHTDHAHEPGTSDILKPGSSRWVGLLFFSILLTSGLSYWVYRYVQVAPVVTKKAEDVV